MHVIPHDDQLTCPLCAGDKMSGDHPCPECKGTGRVPDIFAELRYGRCETAEETAEAECRPLDEVQAEAARARRWLTTAPNERPECADDDYPGQTGSR